MAKHTKVTRRSGDVPWSAPHRGEAAASRVGRSASAERTRKVAIRKGTEVARGIRQPANFAERNALEWASPRKIAQQRALTGNALRPRLGPEGALHTARGAAGGFRTNRLAVQSTYQTFAAGRRATSSSAAVPRRGERLTALGRWYASRGM